MGGSAVHVSVGDNGGRVADGHPYSLLQEITSILLIGSGNCKLVVRIRTDP